METTTFEGPSTLQLLEQQQQRQQAEQTVANGVGAQILTQTCDPSFFQREWEPMPFGD